MDDIIECCSKPFTMFVLTSVVVSPCQSAMSPAVKYRSVHRFGRRRRQRNGVFVYYVICYSQLSYFSVTHGMCHLLLTSGAGFLLTYLHCLALFR